MSIDTNTTAELRQAALDHLWQHNRDWESAARDQEPLIFVAGNGIRVTDSDGQIVYMGNPVGFILEAPGEKTTYIMGDTGVFGDMGLYNELWSPKVGIVPIGDRFTMGARLAAFACRRYFDFDTVIPCHFATFPPLDQTADKFLAEMGDQAGRVKVLPIGTAETV